jgi:hypothetical protein
MKNALKAIMQQCSNSQTQQQRKCPSLLLLKVVRYEISNITTHPLLISFSMVTYLSIVF